jgi:hypothetical protein
MHQNALRDPPIEPNVKTQFRRNVSCRTFYGIRTGPTRAIKILHQRCVPRTHQNALRDPQITADAKTQLWRSVFKHSLNGNHTRPPEQENSVLTFRSPDAPESTI